MREGATSLARVPRPLLVLLALALGGASSFLAACGDRNGLLPASKANAMIQDLNSVSDAIGSGNCVTAQRAVARAKNVLHSAITSRRTLTDRLRLELDHLAGVAATQCQPTTTTTTTPTTATTATSTQTTATSPTTATTTTSSPTTDTSSTQTSTDTTTAPTDTGGQTNGGAAPGDGGGKNGHKHGQGGNGSGGGGNGGN